MIIKKLIYFLRNKKLIISQVLFPGLVITLNLFYIKHVVSTSEELPPLKISLSSYDHNYVAYDLIGNNSLINSLSQTYKNTLINNEKVILFQLNETSSNNFCETFRSNIDSYLSCVSKISYKALNKEHFVSTEFKYIEEGERKRDNFIMKITGHFNNQPYHTPPLAVNLITNALLKHFTNSTESKIVVINKPLSKNFSEKIEKSTEKNMNNFRIASGLNFGFSFLIASFSIFLINENICGAKQMQFIKGCNPFNFWISHLLTDMINYMISVSSVILVLYVSLIFNLKNQIFYFFNLFKLFDVEQLLSEIKWIFTLIILLIYGLTHITQIYLFSFKFNLASTGFSVLTGWNIISSIKKKNFNLFFI